MLTNKYYIYDKHHHDLMSLSNEWYNNEFVVSFNSLWDCKLRLRNWNQKKIVKIDYYSFSPLRTKTSMNEVSSLVQKCLQTAKIHTTAKNLDIKQTEKSINQVTLLGRVGADPQKRGSEEHPVVNFPLATHYSYKYESGDILEKTDWHRISIFKPSLRESVYKYLKKGQRVYVTGKISYGEVKLEDGQVRTASTIIADDVIFFQGQQPKIE